MDKRTEGIVVSVKRQWWLKINSKQLRTGPLDGATFPYIIKVKYTVDGNEYIKWKCVSAGLPEPKVGNTVQVLYSSDKPSKAKVI